MDCHWWPDPFEAIARSRRIIEQSRALLAWSEAALDIRLFVQAAPKLTDCLDGISGFGTDDQGRDAEQHSLMPERGGMFSRAVSAVA